MPTTLAEALDLLNRGGTLLLLFGLCILWFQGKIVAGVSHQRELDNKDMYYGQLLADKDKQIERLGDQLDASNIARDRAIDLTIFGVNMAKESLGLTHSVIRGTGVDSEPVVE